MVGEEETPNKCFVIYGKNTENSLVRTVGGHPTPRRSNCII